MSKDRGEGRQPLGAARPLIFPLFLSPSPPIESNPPIERKHPHYSTISYRRDKRVEYLDKSPFDRL